MGTAADLERVAQHTFGGRSVHTRVIAGATHMYDGREEAVAALIAEWASSLPQP